MPEWSRDSLFETEWFVTDVDKSSCCFSLFFSGWLRIFHTCKTVLAVSRRSAAWFFFSWRQVRITFTKSVIRNNETVQNDICSRTNTNILSSSSAFSTQKNGSAADISLHVVFFHRRHRLRRRCCLPNEEKGCSFWLYLRPLHVILASDNPHLVRICVQNFSIKKLYIFVHRNH